MMDRHAIPCRRGFTRLDLGAVLAVLGVGIALILPAAQQSRSTTRLLQGIEGREPLDPMPRVGQEDLGPAAVVAEEVVGHDAEAWALAMADRYVAIAYSPDTGSYGCTWNHATRSEAEVEALARCGAPDCRIVVWARNACAALAVASNQGYGYGWSSDRRQAEVRALEECSRHGVDCRLLCSVCTDDGE